MGKGIAPGVAGAASLDPRRWLALSALRAAFFIDVLDFSIINVALPDVQRDIGFSHSGLWKVNLSTIRAICTQLSAMGFLFLAD